MTSLESIVLPLEQSRALVEHGIVLETALVWIRLSKGLGEPIWGAVDVRERLNAYCPILAPAPVLSEMTTWLMCHDCDDITFTNETADGENAVGARCNNSEGRNFEAHKADELLAAADLLLEVSK